MKRLLILAATATLAASAADARLPRPGPGGPPQVPANCPLTIAFGSYGPGIDGPTLANVERMLRTDRRVRSVSRHPWGREGEVTLCVRPRRIADAGRLAQRIRAMIPARPRGPVQVELPGRLPY
jgi:hypothetical protein